MRKAKDRKQKRGAATPTVSKARPFSGSHAGRDSRRNAAVAAVTIIVGLAIATFLFFANPLLVPFEAYWLVNAVVLLWIPLTVILTFFREDPTHFGLTAGEKGYGWKFTAVAILFMLPIVFYASQEHQFRQTYGDRLTAPMMWLGQAVSPCLHVFTVGRPAIQTVRVNSYPALIYYELGMGFYLFCWEYFYRGFMLFGLARSKRLGNIGAVVIQAFLFALLHWSLNPRAAKPPQEIISAFFGGLALGALAIRTRSFFYGFVIHWSIALAMDALVITPQLFRL